MKKINKTIFTFLIFFFALFITGCQTASPVSYEPPADLTDSSYIPKRDILVIGIRGDVFGFYPDITTYESATLGVSLNIFDSLIELDRNNKIQPSLATSWENPDDLTWRFYLRKDVKFHSGHDFTAQDVKYSIESLLAVEDHIFRDLIVNIEQINIIDDYTIDIVTTDPKPAFLNNLNDVFILSEDYEKNTVDKIPNGTSAYQFKEYKRGDLIELTLNDNYWKGAEDKIKRIRYKIILDDDERINALLARKIDFAELLPADRLNELSADDRIRVVLAPGSRVIILRSDFRINGSHAFPDGENPTANLKVRQAMYHAIDEDKILKRIMNGVGELTSQPIASDVFGYNPEIKRLPHDIERARGLMKEAGYEKGFTIDMDCPNDRYMNDAQICVEVASQLRTIGINVNLNITSKVDFFPKVIPANSSFHLLGWSTGPDAGEMLNLLVHTRDKDEGYGSMNTAYYSNSDVDELAKEVSRTINPDKRLDLMQRAFKIAMDDVAFIPLHRQKLIYGLVPDVFWEPRADERLKFEEMRIE